MKAGDWFNWKNCCPAVRKYRHGKGSLPKKDKYFVGRKEPACCKPDLKI
jgi:hypothetical protein